MRHQTYLKREVFFVGLLNTQSCSHVLLIIGKRARQSHQEIERHSTRENSRYHDAYSYQHKLCVCACVTGSGQVVYTGGIASGHTQDTLQYIKSHTTERNHHQEPRE